MINLFKKFGKISGSMLNKQKSFIIKIGESNDSYHIADVPVLKHLYKIKIVRGENKKVYCGEFGKILGIFFGASVKHYVDKNWRELYSKCNSDLNKWDGKINTIPVIKTRHAMEKSKEK